MSVAVFVRPHWLEGPEFAEDRGISTTPRTTTVNPLVRLYAQCYRNVLPIVTPFSNLKAGTLNRTSQREPYTFKELFYSPLTMEALQ